MRNGMLHRAGAGVVLLAGLVATAEAWAQERPSEEPTCSAEIAAESIPVHPDLFEVRVTFTERIGERIAALFQEESRVTVVEIERDLEQPRSVRLTLNTSEAVVGEWTLVLEGEEGRCEGEARVRPIETRRSLH